MKKRDTFGYGNFKVKKVIDNKDGSKTIIVRRSFWTRFLNWINQY